MNKNKSSSKSYYADLLQSQRGSSILEILLVMAIVTALSPFLYNQISETARDIRDISTAKKIIKFRDPALNFVRLNQDTWPDVAQIKLDDDELKQITDAAHSGFIDKYMVNNNVVTDIYLAFYLDDNALHAAKIAKHIGTDAASVDKDGVAYGSSWAVSAPDFKTGDLIYRINYNFNGDDTSKYLHRGTSGEDDFNVMQRILNMGNLDIYNIGTIAGESGKIQDSSASFIETNDATASSVYFEGGVNMDGNGVKIDSMRISGDITGFRNISTKKLNGDGFSTNGTIITDRANVKNSVNVGKDMIIKSDSSKTISGFSGIIAHSLYTSFLYSDEIHFYNNFGLTISGELMMSTTSPLKIGSWYFPSTTPPKFSEFKLSRATIPSMPNVSEFDKLMQSTWKD
ncbi:MAG: hypothetical protein JW974_03415 [Alphaproteobacteria bacterium]|nr:hypothetical protein [Alphaproteobacteria bacterium]MBN2675287.1 hypothetical protein [Alphaproteobacteria bacterium]